jgi:beta-N-acetylhexosaminidase
MKSGPELHATELVPFKALVSSADPIPSVMTGHMALPNVTGDDTPCSLSRHATTHLLRDEMGYPGLIVTDCLEMEAVAKAYGSEEGAVMSLAAGADIVMICHTMRRQRGAVEAAYRAVEDGRLSLADLRASGERIRALKEKYCGSWDAVLEQRGLDPAGLEKIKRANLALSKQAYAASLALVRDPRGTLPLKDGASSLLLLTPRMESVNLAVDDAEGVLRNADGTKRNTAGPSYLAFAKAFSGHVDDLRHIVYSAESIHTALPDVSTVQSIVVALRNADRSSWQIDFLRKVVDACSSSAAKIVIVSTCTPYDLLDVDHAGIREVAYLATFEFTKPALENVADALFMADKSVGKVPVLRGEI